MHLLDGVRACSYLTFSLSLSLSLSHSLSLSLQFNMACVPERCDGGRWAACEMGAVSTWLGWLDLSPSSPQARHQLAPRIKVDHDECGVCAIMKTHYKVVKHEHAQQQTNEHWTNNNARLAVLVEHNEWAKGRETNSLTPSLAITQYNRN